MKKVFFIAAAVLTLAWGRTVMACSQDSDCNPTGGTRVCVCADTSGQAPDPSTGQACGNTEIIPGVLEVGGCANQAGAEGCIEVAETVAIGGSAAAPIVAPLAGTHADCDAAANAACIACGCGVCADSAEL